MYTEIRNHFSALPIMLIVLACFIAAGASSADTSSAKYSNLQEKLTAEGFDLQKTHEKVHPLLLQELENGLEQSYLKGASTRTVRIDVHLHRGAGAANRGSLKTSASLKTRGGLMDRQARVKVVQDNVRRAMYGIYGLDRFRIRFEYENLFGFSAEADYRAVAALSKLDEVARIELIEKPVPQDEDSFELTKVRYVRQDNYKGRGVTIAIIDGGIDWSHGAFGGHSSFPNDKIIGGRDLANDDDDPMADCSDDDHGTPVAAIAAGDNSNMTGVASHAKLVHVKIDDACTGTWASVTEALDWVISNATSLGIDIVNLSMSVGTPRYSSYCDNVINTNMQTALEDLADLDIPFFAAAGNQGDKSGIKPPACSSKAVAVGAVYDDNFTSPYISSSGGCVDLLPRADHVTCYSNSAEIVDILAPGSCYKTAKRGGGTYCVNGTSVASPFAAGVAALMMERSDKLNRRSTIYSLKEGGLSVKDDANNVRNPRIQAKASSNIAGDMKTFQLLALDHVGSGEGGTLYRVDHQTGDNFTIEDLSGDAVCAANMAWASDESRLYGIGCEGTGSGSTLFVIDEVTGFTNHSLTLSGDQAHASTIAFNPLDNTLYGINSSGSHPGWGTVLFTIDRGTGVTTNVNTLWGDHTHAASIAFSKQGDLYGIDYALPWNQPTHLFEIDSASGQTTTVGQLSGHRTKATSIRFHNDLFAINRSGDGKGNTLFKINPSTAVTTDVGPLGGDHGEAVAIEFVR